MAEPETYQEFMHPRGVSLRVYAQRIEAWCEHCGQMVSETPFEASPLEASQSGHDDDGPPTIGEAAADAALDHIKTAHGL